MATIKGTWEGYANRQAQGRAAANDSQSARCDRGRAKATGGDSSYLPGFDQRNRQPRRQYH